jgi:hypothetical protein
MAIKPRAIVAAVRMSTGGIVMRFVVYCSLFAGCFQSGPAVAEEPADGRNYWVYEGGWFIQQDGKTWIEMNEEVYSREGKPYSFKEMFRTPDIIELRDEGRKVSVRLMEECLLVKPDSDRAYSELYPGRWKSRTSGPTREEIDKVHAAVGKLGGRFEEMPVHLYEDWGVAGSRGSAVWIRSIKFENATDQLLADLPVIPYPFDLSIAHFGKSDGFTDAGIRALGKQVFLKQLTIHHSKVTGAGLASLAKLPRLESLSVTNFKFDARGIGGLRDCKTLKCLTLLRTEVGDEGVAEVGRITSLRMLELYGNNITDKGIASLGDLHDLVELDVGDSSFSGVGFGELKNAKKLKLLHLGREITDEGLREIGRLTSLRRLAFRSDKVTDAGAKDLRNLTALQHLTLTTAKLTDAGLEQLAPLTKLRYLDVEGTRVTDAGLKHLHGMKDLTFFQRGGTGITDAGVAELKKVLTNLF